MVRVTDERIDKSWSKVNSYLEAHSDNITNYRKAEAVSPEEFILYVLANSTNLFTYGTKEDWGVRTASEREEHEQRVEALRRQPEFADVLNTWDTEFSCISFKTLVWIQPYGLFVNGELKVDRKKRETIFNKEILRREVESELRAAMLEEIVKGDSIQLVDALIEEIADNELMFTDYREEILRLLRKALVKMKTNNEHKTKD